MMMMMMKTVAGNLFAFVLFGVVYVRTKKGWWWLFHRVISVVMVDFAAFAAAAAAAEAEGLVSVSERIQAPECGVPFLVVYGLAADITFSIEQINRKIKIWGKRNEELNDSKYDTGFYRDKPG